MHLRSIRLRFTFRCLTLCLMVAATALPTVLANGQGTPHLSVDTLAYHTLVPPGISITKEMCLQGNPFCLAAVGKPLLYNGGLDGINAILPFIQIYATDQAGNVYVIDSGNQILFKVTPQGQISYIAGEYGVAASSYPPLTGPAASTILNFPTALTVDTEGNIFVETGAALNAQGLPNTIGVTLKIDTNGVAHRLTAPKTLGTTEPVEGALASSQFVPASGIATAPNGDLYLADSNTCTIRVLSAKNGTLNTLVGNLSNGCTGSAATYEPISGENAASQNIKGILAISSAANGKLYLLNGDLLEVDSGKLYVKATANLPSIPGTPPLAASYLNSLAVDAAGDAYFTAQQISASSDPENEVSYVSATALVEQTQDSVLRLASGAGNTISGEEFSTQTPEGMPSNIALLGQGSVTLDPFGRLILTSESVNVPPSSFSSDGIAYLDRNGSVVFNNIQGDTKNYPALPQTITLINSGDAPLTTVNIANTGYPYYLVPAATEIKAAGISGSAPFSVDQTTGTCRTLFAKTGILTLQPGTSCTITFDYTPNAGLPPVGSFTLYTNDPRGPLTINLSAYPVTGSNLADFSFPPFIFDTPFYGVNISSTVLTPASTISNNGSFSIDAAVASSIYNPNAYSSLPGNVSYPPPDFQVPITPTGRIYAAVSNSATGAVTVTTANSLDADGKTTFTFTGLAPGTYSLQGVYLGDGKSAASFSNVQTLSVMAQH